MEHTRTATPTIPNLPAPDATEHDEDHAVAIPMGFTLLAVLRELEGTDGPRPHQLRDIAAKAHLNVQHTHRLLTAALSRGLVTRPERGLYQLASDGGPLDESAEQQPLLSALSAEAHCPALLFAMTLLPGLSRRFLVAQDLGHDTEELRRTPKRQQGNLKLAPLTSDPAGQVIAAYRNTRDLLPPDMQRIRQAGVAYGPSPLTGWSLIAAPVFRAGDATGSVALLLRESQMSQPRLRARRTAQLMDTAAALSGQLGREQQATDYRRAS